ncbi:cupin domain-containing protein [Desulfobulbus oligotrophicus]|jgi:quercetin dioxygenase-like cupin family protein|uniref:Cupin domain-containing protein n=1 Tax=Desulfobulbus oligotrophicus TaxID=1909699 RepID=A0A7T5VD33_9BACT|nr:cupin domain-containing protein [Desulfobulbus oligotrophicus]MDY0391079.1 cupin domain-containing protein [Desulfobulbus oligotrophicus]QQG65682.1 cupin domain-containing protein [Desulfobulbus oligotrophicus]
MHNWTFLHLFVDEDDVSRVDPHFTQELTAIEFAPPAPPMFVSHPMDVQSLAMIELPVGWQGGWHPSPRKQWVICLAGEMGYEAGDGTVFTLHPGTCILTTDIRGKGHNSWNAGTVPVRLALVQL